jgi:hypothetical protein
VKQGLKDGVNRETVSRYVELALQANQIGPAEISNPANAPIEPAAPRGYPAALSNPARPPFERCPPIGAAPGCHSDCQRWRAIIEGKQALGFSAKRIHQDFVSERAAVVGYDSVRRFLWRLGWPRVNHIEFGVAPMA